MTDTNCQRASQSLYETIRSRVTRVRLLFPRGFSSKRETARSLIRSGKCPQLTRGLGFVRTCFANVSQGMFEVS